MRRPRIVWDVLQRGKLRRIGGAGAVAPAGEHDLARVDGLGAARSGAAARERSSRSRSMQRRLDAILDSNWHGVAHPQQVGQPIGGGDLGEALPALGPVLGLVPGAERERGEAEVGPGQVLGRAQRIHARIGAPRALAAARRAVDDAHVAHAVAGEREGRRLPAHAAADDEHVERRPAVGAGNRRHPVGGRKKHALEVAAGFGSEGFQAASDRWSSPSLRPRRCEPQPSSAPPTRQSGLRRWPRAWPPSAPGRRRRWPRRAAWRRGIPPT